MNNVLTIKVLEELISHEAIVKESYVDSVDVWSWSIGITNSSGHRVFPRYKDNPQTVERCLEVFIWVVQNKYIPAIKEVFQGYELSEEQFAATLSFHYNTGGIRRALWIKQWKAGEVDSSYRSIMNWKSPPEIIPRREKERELFFNGFWSNTGEAIVYNVSKPSYFPDWRSAKKVEIKAILEKLLE